MKREMVRLETTAEALRKLEDITTRRGVTRLAVLSRLVEWFADQPETIQAVIMNHIPEGIAVDVVKLILERAARK